MNICTFDDFITQKGVLTSNINISIDQSNILFNNDIPRITSLGVNFLNRIEDGTVYIKSLLSSNLTITEDNTTIYISQESSQTVSTSSIGVQSYALFNNTNNLLLFKSLVNGTDINVRSDNNNLYVDNLSPHQTLLVSGGDNVSVNYSGLNIINIDKISSNDSATSDLVENATRKTFSTSYTPQIFTTDDLAGSNTFSWSGGTNIVYTGNDTRYFELVLAYGDRNVPNNRTLTSAVFINDVILLESEITQNGRSEVMSVNIIKLQKNDYITIYNKADAAYSDTVGTFPEINFHIFPI